MVLRLLGLAVAGVLIVILFAAAPPLAIVGLGLTLLLLRPRRSRAPVKRRSQARRTLTPRRPIRRTTRRPSSPLARRVVLWFAGGLLVLALGPALAREIPPAGVPPLAVIGAGTALLVLRRTGGLGQRREPGAFRTASAFQFAADSKYAVGTAFELAVADLLSRRGYRHVRHLGGANDAGVDIIAEDRRGRVYLIQCKCFSGGTRVGSVDVQKLIGAVAHRGAAGGILITNSSFTVQAGALARSGKIPITLMDGAALRRLDGHLFASAAG